MAKKRMKWKFAFIIYLVLLNVFAKSLPISNNLPELRIIDDSFVVSRENFIETPSIVDIADGTELNVVPKPESVIKGAQNESRRTVVTVEEEIAVQNDAVATVEQGIAIQNDLVATVEQEIPAQNMAILREPVRPGQVVASYAVDITLTGSSFRGRAVLEVRLTAATREDCMMFHLADLNVQSVEIALFTAGFSTAATYFIEDNILHVEPSSNALSYIIIVEYTGQIRDDGRGLFRVDDSFVGMNLYPTNARRVFPCMDELDQASTFTFTINGAEYTHLVANTQLVGNSNTQFRAFQGAPHQFGMVAHNFVNINIPTTNVLLFGRTGVINQDNQASVAINFYFNALNEWTERDYFEIMLDQNGRLNVLALPDTNREWYSLSTVCIWEPYVFMENNHAVAQRAVVMREIALGMSRQWFGYVIYPENWRHSWVTTGLATYTAYEIFEQFQTNPNDPNDSSLLDVNSLFVADVIRESMLRDSYTDAQVIEPDQDIHSEKDIRDHLNGLVKWKAPAIMRMLRWALGGANDDFIHRAGSVLLASRALQTVNSMNLVDAINSYWLVSDSQQLGDVAEFLDTWVSTPGYPVVHVGLRQNGIFLTRDHFGFSPRPSPVGFVVPLTYTTSINPNFDNLQPSFILEEMMTPSVALGEEDWIIFNIQGQGYYRVNYDNDLWERLIDALSDPDRRRQIHPLNRAALVDDALNLARGGQLSYDVALQVALSMEHETDYAVWKVYMRNMDFLRKNLVAFTIEEELNLNIYTRMLARTISSLEEELGFYPDPLLNEPAMASLTRGLVMKHACLADYQPCIAAAVDWFYDPNDNEVVNPDIPHDMRPAVYCTMVREGGADAVAALTARLELESAHYERLVILQAFACSQDANYIRQLLESTVQFNSPYGVEERLLIFKAVAESSYDNARIAANFLFMRSTEIRNRYGGTEKLEEVIFIVAENMASPEMISDLTIWLNSLSSNLDDSRSVANRASAFLQEDLTWRNNHLETVYEWIDENDASTTALSLLLLAVSLFVALCNH